MGGAVSAGKNNDELVDNLVDADYIKSALVEKVFRAVDRGNYYLPGHTENAYKDLAWKHEHLHLSAPCIYSEVMECLKLERGMSFLNLGSGTGYLNSMVGLVLGPYGINHGVELHEDVVEFARERLTEFKHKCNDFDDFEFCEPSFVVGNCLQLSSACPQYQRVYCGAACPPEHANYMRNLLSINGILIMPLNDQLMQIERTGETTFESKSVMSVSFATLVVPSKEKSQEMVDLPEIKLPLLQDLCRVEIRKILRQNIYDEHPSFSKPRVRPPKRERKRSQEKRRINILPMPRSMGMMILSNFDGGQLSDEDDDDDEEEEEDMEEDHITENNENTRLLEESGQESDHQSDEDEKKEKDCECSYAEEGSVNANKTEQRNVDTKNEDQDPEKLTENQESEDKLEAMESEEEDDFVSYRLSPTQMDYARQFMLDIVSGGRENIEQGRSRWSPWELVQPPSLSDTDDSDAIDEDITDHEESRGQSLVNIPEAGESSTDEGLIEQTDKDNKDNCTSVAARPTEFLMPSSHIPVSYEKSRKQRYSSSTSVDTSDTSGIGSLSDASALTSLADDLTPSNGHDKSPSSASGGSVDACSSGMGSNSDQDADEVALEEDVRPKETVSLYMKEKVDFLPLPPSLKMYILHYRE